MNSSNSSLALSVRSEPLKKQKAGSLNSAIQSILPNCVKKRNAKGRYDEETSSMGDFEDPDFKMAMLLQEEEMKRVEERRAQIAKDEELSMKMLQEEAQALNVTLVGLAPQALNGKRSAEQAFGDNDHANDYEKQFLIQKKKILEKETKKKEEEERVKREEEEKRRKEEEEKRECCYCLDKPIDAILLPCKQQICCLDCARKLYNEKKNCPYCSRAITGVKKAPQKKKSTRTTTNDSKSKSRSKSKSSTFSLKANAKLNKGSKAKGKGKGKGK